MMLKLILTHYDYLIYIIFQIFIVESLFGLWPVIRLFSQPYAFDRSCRYHYITTKLFYLMKTMDTNNTRDILKSRITDGDLNKFYQHVTGNSYKHYVHHDFLLSQNLHEEDLLCDSINKNHCPFYISPPLPAMYSKSKNIYDTGLQNIIEKEKWKLKIKRMKAAYKNIAKRRKITNFDTKSSTATVPLYLLKFAKLLLEDPDPYFDSEYNWYFSGNGNLCPLYMNGLIYIIKSSGNTVCLNKMKDDKYDEELCNYSISNNDIIYETLYIYSKSLHIIGLRVKFGICLLNIGKSDEKLELKMKAKIKTASPISSFVIDRDLNVCYSCVNGGIYYHDIETNNCIEIRSSFKNDKLVNYWSSLHLLDNDLLQTTSDELNIYDRRKENKIDSIDQLVNTMNCEKITASKMYNLNYIYIGSTHSVQLYDIRLCDRNRPNFLKLWTHGLQTPPLYIQIGPLLKNEIICVSNQNIKDICLILNLENYDNMEIDCKDSLQCTSENILLTDQSDKFLPSHPSTIMDTFNIAQKKGYCLDPIVNLSKRLNTSRIGNAFFEYDNDNKLITLNSLGEIFQQKISNSNEFVDEETLGKSLQLWADQISTTASFSATEEINLTYHYNVIKYRGLAKIGRDRIKKSLMANNRWRNKLKYMFDCTDFCAHEFLSAWELSSEDLGIESLVPPPPDTKFNVKTWMSDFNDF